MNLMGFDIDEKRMAAGIYDMFSENDLAALSFGMLPAPIMEVLEKGLSDKTHHELAQSSHLDMSPEKVDVFVNEVTRAIAVEIYSIHSRAGKMLV